MTFDHPNTRELAILDALTLIIQNASAARENLATRRVIAAQKPRLELAGNGILARINGNGNLNVPSQSAQQTAAVQQLASVVGSQIGAVVAYARSLDQIVRGDEPDEPDKAG